MLFSPSYLELFVIPSSFFLSFRAVARNPPHGCFTSLRFVQHDKSGVIPSNSEESTHGCFTSLRFVQHDKSGVIPSNSEKSSMWMLRYAQHDKARIVNALLRSS